MMRRLREIPCRMLARTAVQPRVLVAFRIQCAAIERLSLTLRGLTSNGKRQKWNFCRLSLAL